MAVLLLFWIPWCFINAEIAKEKARSYWGVFFVSLVLSPVLGWAYVAAVPARSAPSYAPEPKAWPPMDTLRAQLRDDVDLKGDAP